MFVRRCLEPILSGVRQHLAQSCEELCGIVKSSLSSGDDMFDTTALVGIGRIGFATELDDESELGRQWIRQAGGWVALGRGVVGHVLIAVGEALRAISKES
ncbi:MAG TPA: hypothetical protein VEB21_19970 [Terriglobales bacterium]|nr:hypothetical protein [Terriglobales bacterium]